MGAAWAWMERYRTRGVPVYGGPKMRVPTIFSKLSQSFQRLNVQTFERYNVTPNLVSDDHWQTISGRKHDRTWSEIQEMYTDALTAWRKNPMAWRIINTTVNF